MREKELFERLEGGDLSALDGLIGAYYPEILRFCLRHTPTRECAEDAAQETFLRCVRHIDAYAHRGHFRAWLYKIAANACADILRRSHSDAELPDAAGEEPGYERAELKTDLERALARLPEAQRELLLLRYAHELTLREIAEIQGLPLRTAQSRLRAALKAMKKLM